MSLGLVVLEKKLFMRTRTRTRTPTPQSDDIMSADIKKTPTPQSDDIMSADIKKQYVSRPCSFGGEVVHAKADAVE